MEGLETAAGVGVAADFFVEVEVGFDAAGLALSDPVRL